MNVTISYEADANEFSEKPSTLDVGDKLKNMVKRLTDLVDQKVGEAMKTTCEKVKKKRCRSRHEVR